VSRAIDVSYHGYDRVICAYEVDGVIVDPGPAVSLETLIDALGPTVPRALLLTHIHLDHAGGAGVLARRFPELVVYVSEKGAPHLIDPSKLLSSAARVYGEENMEPLWGEVAPVPEERVRAIAEGDLVEGFRVAYTRGHANHHVCYLHEDTGDAYVGDMAGVRIPPHDYTVMPTPPPEIDVEAWLDSLHAIAKWDPKALCLTHFGRVPDVEDQLHRARTNLLDRAEQARYAIAEDFTRKVEEEMRAAVDEETADRFVRAIPPHHIWDGFERYWRKRAEKEADAA
jgi:glyoxylase-like metal-dependent hydrolase (beta-lactamase superfamily II)